MYIYFAQSAIQSKWNEVIIYKPFSCCIKQFISFIVKKRIAIQFLLTAFSIFYSVSDTTLIYVHSKSKCERQIEMMNCNIEICEMLLCSTKVNKQPQVKLSGDRDYTMTWCPDVLMWHLTQHPTSSNSLRTVFSFLPIKASYIFLFSAELSLYLYICHLPLVILTYRQALPTFQSRKDSMRWLSRRVMG